MKKIINNLKDKKILILGIGKEGIDTLNFLRKLFPNKNIGIADKIEFQKLNIKDKELIKKDKYVKLHLGKNYLKILKDYDLIIKSPGIPMSFLEIKKAQKKGKITSQTEIFFKYCPGKIIGITGTKGKGTVSSLIYQILKYIKSKNREIYLVGNIGNPVLSFLLKSKPKDIFIYELSSHQLMDIKYSNQQQTGMPFIAIFLNIFPAHLDYYKNFKEYFQAKENITLYQKKDNFFIYPKKLFPLIETLSKKTKAKKISFSMVKPISKTRSEKKTKLSPPNNKQADCYIKDNYIFYNKEKIFKIENSPLLGNFNILNIMPAIIVGKLFKISNKEITEAIKKFKSLPYRLEFIGNYSGIKFYNDSLATIPEATISAIKSFTQASVNKQRKNKVSSPNNDLQTIILGGSDSNIKYKNLAKEILKSNINNLIFFPVTGKKIWKEIIKNPNSSKFKYFFINKKKKTSSSSLCGAQYMENAVKLAYKHTEKGKICLLSPAAPSFSIFKNYKERGDLFKKYVKERKKTI